MSLQSSRSELASNAKRCPESSSEFAKRTRKQREALPESPQSSRSELASNAKRCLDPKPLQEVPVPLRALQRTAVTGMHVLLDHNPAVIPDINQRFGNRLEVQVTFPEL